MVVQQALGGGPHRRSRWTVRKIKAAATAENAALAAAVMAAVGAAPAALRGALAFAWSSPSSGGAGLPPRAAGWARPIAARAAGLAAPDSQADADHQLAAPAQLLGGASAAAGAGAGAAAAAAAAAALAGRPARRRLRQLTSRTAEGDAAASVADNGAAVDEATEKPKKPRPLSDPDDRPVGEANLIDPEARDKAIHYLTKRQKIDDERFSTEQEWIHMFSVVGDLGSAMELGAKKDELEQQLEEMSEREGEIAEKLVEIRGLRSEVRAGQTRFDRLGEELEQAQRDQAGLLSELEECTSKATSRQKEVAALKMRLAELREESEASKTALAAAAEEEAATRAKLEELEKAVAEQKSLLAPREEELEELRARLEAMESEKEALAAAAEKDATELEIGKGRIESLEASIKELNQRRSDLEVKNKETEQALVDLPKELESVTREVDDLEKKAAELEKAMGPEGAELQRLQTVREEAKTELDQLKARQAEVQQQQSTLQSDADSMKAEQAELEDEIKDIEERKVKAEDERDRLMRFVPKMLRTRNSMLEDVASAVEEAKLMREELLAQARTTQERLNSIALESALASEEEVLQATAAEIGRAAQASSEGLRKAQAALETAITARKRVEGDFSRLRDAMERRLSALKAQEDALASVADDNKGIDSEVQALIETTASQVEQFRSARQSVSRFQKQIRRITQEPAEHGEGGEQQEALSSAVSGAFGLFGTLLKASAQGLREGAAAAKAAEEQKRLNR